MELIIKSNIPEQKFMESCLNMEHSGLDCMFPLTLYALTHRWHIDKLTYYLKLIGKQLNLGDKNKKIYKPL